METDKVIQQTNPETGEVEIRPIQTNSRVSPAQSHHRAKSKLPGGDKYTGFTKWRRRIFAAFFILLIGWFCYQIAINMNVGGIVQAPEGPSTAQAQGDFKKATAPGYSTMKYLSDTSSGTPTVENVEIGRVVSKTGEVSVGYSCEVTADVKFSNSSINSTSKMRMKYSYNSLLHTWESGEITTEQSNYHPNSGPDLNKLQDDALNILSEYDSNAGSKMKGCSITREGEISKDGGETTFTLTKTGAGANGADLVKQMKTRVMWSEVSGWVAGATWVSTTGAGVGDDENQSTDDQETKTEEVATQELECTSGELVQLSGSISGTTLTTTNMTKYVIDGSEYKTKDVVLLGNTSSLSDSASTQITGNLSIVENKVTLIIP